MPRNRGGPPRRQGGGGPARRSCVYTRMTLCIFTKCFVCGGGRRPSRSLGCSTVRPFGVSMKSCCSSSSRDTPSPGCCSTGVGLAASLWGTESWRESKLQRSSRTQCSSSSSKKQQQQQAAAGDAEDGRLFKALLKRMLRLLPAAARRVVRCTYTPTEAAEATRHCCMRCVLHALQHCMHYCMQYRMQWNSTCTAACMHACI